MHSPPFAPTHIHTHNPARLHTYIPTHIIHTHTYPHTYIHTHIHTHTHTHTHTYIHTHTYTHTHTYIQLWALPAFLFLEVVSAECAVSPSPPVIESPVSCSAPTSAASAAVSVPPSYATQHPAATCGWPHDSAAAPAHVCTCVHHMWREGGSGEREVERGREGE